MKINRLKISSNDKNRFYPLFIIFFTVLPLSKLCNLDMFN